MFLCKIASPSGSPEDGAQTLHPQQATCHLQRTTDEQHSVERRPPSPCVALPTSFECEGCPVAGEWQPWGQTAAGVSRGMDSHRHGTTPPPQSRIGRMCPHLHGPPPREGPAPARRNMPSGRSSGGRVNRPSLEAGYRDVLIHAGGWGGGDLAAPPPPGPNHPSTQNQKIFLSKKMKL